MSHSSLIPTELIEQSILLIRGQKVMLDRDLAQLYGVLTKVLNQAVMRNRKRFPADFMFQLSPEEFDNWRSQIVTSNSTEKSLRSQIATLKNEQEDTLRSQTVTSKERGGRRYLPYVFTEQGVAMLSSVLHSPRAISVNIEIMRAFVRLRQFIASHAELSEKLNALEAKYDEHFSIVFDAIRKLMEPPKPSKRRKIGFRVK